VDVHNLSDDEGYNSKSLGAKHVWHGRGENKDRQPLNGYPLVFQMHIKILGTRGEIRLAHPKHVRHSGVLIDKKLLFDLGEKAFLKWNPRSIFITHLHPDHAFFMASAEEITIDVPVFAPETSHRLTAMKVIAVPMQLGRYKITPIPVTHSIKVKALGFLIEKGDKRIFYTGDLISVRERYFETLGKLDAVITEASFLRKGGLVRKNEQGEIFGHAGVSDLVNLFSTFTSRIIFTHFGSCF